jgi:hypothetical protein
MTRIGMVLSARIFIVVLPSNRDEIPLRPWEPTTMEIAATIIGDIEDCSIGVLG